MRRETIATAGFALLLLVPIAWATEYYLEVDKTLGVVTDVRLIEGQPPVIEPPPVDPPPVDPPASGHAFFDALVAHPAHHSSWTLRSQASIDAATKNDKPNTVIVYDPVQDAARVPLDSGSMDPSMQLMPVLHTPISNNALFYWEVRWDSGFVALKDADNEVGGFLRQHKSSNIQRNGRIGLETQMRYDDVSGAVGRITGRSYSGNGWPVSMGDGNPIEPQVGEFVVQGDTWTRFWQFVDHGDRMVHLWVGDGTRAPVKVIEAGFNSIPTITDWRIAEHNTSQSGSFDRTLYIWDRNAAILSGLDLAEAEALVR